MKADNRVQQSNGFQILSNIFHYLPFLSDCYPGRHITTDLLGWVIEAWQTPFTPELITALRGTRDLAHQCGASFDVTLTGG